MTTAAPQQPWREKARSGSTAMRGRAREGVQRHAFATAWIVTMSTLTFLAVIFDWHIVLR
jgi:hypothetical protein